MRKKRYTPLIDRLFWIVLFITLPIIVVLTIAVCLFPVPLAICIVCITNLLILYLQLSPLFGYVEFEEKHVLVRFGLLMKRVIPYTEIRSAEKKRQISSDSIISLKCAIEHVNIKYNTFDVLTVSVKDNDALIAELEERLANI